MKRILTRLIKAITLKSAKLNPNAPITWSQLIEALEDERKFLQRMEEEGDEEDTFDKIAFKEENHLS